jgi:hypothetical protein
MGYDAFATGRMEALGAAELAEPAPVYVAHLRSRPHSD